MMRAEDLPRRTGNFDGVQIIDNIMEQPVTANFWRAALSFLRARGSRSEAADEARRHTAQNKAEIAPFLEAVFIRRTL
jgi:hypothetical protein